VPLAIARARELALEARTTAAAGAAADPFLADGWT
jgi:hypothetical protein